MMIFLRLERYFSMFDEMDGALTTYFKENHCFLENLDQLKKALEHSGMHWDGFKTLGDIPITPPSGKRHGIRMIWLWKLTSNMNTKIKRAQASFP